MVNATLPDRKVLKWLNNTIHCQIQLKWFNKMNDQLWIMVMIPLYGGWGSSGHCNLRKHTSEKTQYIRKSNSIDKIQLHNKTIVISTKHENGDGIFLLCLCIIFLLVVKLQCFVWKPTFASKKDSKNDDVLMKLVN